MELFGAILAIGGIFVNHNAQTIGDKIVGIFMMTTGIALVLLGMSS